MSVEHIEILVEEPSIEAALRIMLPKILGGASFEVYPHQCKDDLLQRLPERLRGYARWLPPTWRIVVVVDCDDDDCHTLKQQLEQAAESAGLVTRTRAASRSYAVLNRIVIEELESWYFGDWRAVCLAYPHVPADIPRKRVYRDPDAIAGGTWEAFENVLQKRGYFVGGLRKIEAARAIAPHLEPARNRSRSFQVFRDALLEMAAE